MKSKKIIIWFFTAVLLFLTAFRFMNYAEDNSVIPLYVVVESENKEERIDSWKNSEDEYYFFIPSYAELSHIRMKLNSEEKISINGIHLTDGMLCNDLEFGVPYKLKYYAFGEIKTNNITFIHSENVATMYINTDSGSMDYIHEKKGNGESGIVNLYTSDGVLDYEGEISKINGRGNNTWDFFEKKPYSVTLSYEANLLGMGKAQKWILLANADDSSNLRNKLVYDFAKKIGMQFSPDSQWVELYLNNEYAGLYLLSERNEVHSQRVNISGENSFLVSLERKDRLESQNIAYISTKEKQSLRIHYPLNVSSKDLEQLTNVWQSVENAIVSENGVDNITGKSWHELIDLDSWAKKYLIEEIFGSGDACYISQFFYCDDYSGRIKAGPVWDFDHSMGTQVSWQLKPPNTLYANRFYVKDGYNTPWFYSLYRKEQFYNRVVELYQKEFLKALKELFNEDLRDLSLQISKANISNQIRWNMDDEDVCAQSEYIHSFMNKRISFLNEIWINNKPYHLVKADQGFGAFYAYIAVTPGEILTGLPEFEDTETSVFKGWYYEGTDEPFDATKPITEDIEIYAKWEDSTSNKLDNIVKLIPLGLIAVMFVIFFIIEVKRIKNGGGGLWQKKRK